MQVARVAGRPVPERSARRRRAEPPYIVTIHDAGLSAHGVYIAMERLYGRDLQQALAEGWRPRRAGRCNWCAASPRPWPTPTPAAWCIATSSRPTSSCTKRDKPKVLDFGIARVAHGAALPALDGAVVGSPRYLAPEQLHGGGGRRTHRHSRWAWCSTNCSPAARPSMGDTLAEITAAVLTNHPAPAHELRPGIPAHLSAIASQGHGARPGRPLHHGGRNGADCAAGWNATPEASPQPDVAAAGPVVAAMPAETAPWRARQPHQRPSSGAGRRSHPVPEAPAARPDVVAAKPASPATTPRPAHTPRHHAAQRPPLAESRAATELPPRQHRPRRPQWAACSWPSALGPGRGGRARRGTTPPLTRLTCPKARTPSPCATKTSRPTPCRCRSAPTSR
jgi:hypothetical protein